MTSKSASAAAADGIASSSRSRAISAALASTENPRSRGLDDGPSPCADSSTAPTDAADNVSTIKACRIVEFRSINHQVTKSPSHQLTGSRPLERHLLQGRDSRRHRRMRREQIGPEPFLEVHLPAER